MLKDQRKKEYECLVDDADYEYLSKFKWGLHRQSKSGHLYARRYEDEITETGFIRHWFFMHNEIMQNKNLYVDHKNRNGLDNRRENLRVVTQSENILNSRPFKKMSDLPRGVTRQYHKERLLGYKAQIRVAGHCYYLGFYNNVTLACLAYLNKAKELCVYNHDYGF